MDLEVLEFRKKEVQSLLEDYTSIVEIPTKATKKWLFLDNEYGYFLKYYRDIVRDNRCRHPKRSHQITKQKLKLSDSKIQSKLPSHIQLVKNSYDSTSGFAVFIDSEYGEFKTRVSNIIKGRSGHPKRVKGNKQKAADSKRMSIEDVKSRLPNNILLDESTYYSVRKKCRFIDSEYGEFWSRPYQIFSGQGHPNGMVSKMKKTFLERYGVDNNMKHADLALLNARSRNGVYILKHWKNGEDNICHGSWEVLTVDWLNNNRVDYSWQKEVIQLNKSTYRPDFKIDDVFYEIKGRMDSKSLSKIEEARVMGYHIVVWDREYLIKNNIIVANSKSNIKRANNLSIMPH